MSEALLVEIDGPVATLTINRPESRNPLGQEGDGDLFAAACARINADRGIRAVILTGAGKAFSAGGDVKAMRERGGSFAEAMISAIVERRPFAKPSTPSWLVPHSGRDRWRNVLQIVQWIIVAVIVVAVGAWAGVVAICGSGCGCSDPPMQGSLRVNPGTSRDSLIPRRSWLA